MTITALDSATLAIMNDETIAEFTRLGDAVAAADAAFHAAMESGSLKEKVGALRALHKIRTENTRAASRIVNAI